MDKAKPPSKWSGLIFIALLQAASLLAYGFLRSDGVLPSMEEAMVFRYGFGLLALILLINALVRYRRGKQQKQRQKHTRKALRFSPQHVDNYVFFVGRLVDKSPTHLPLSGQACLFYSAFVLALWQSKRKKPNKGMEKHRKVIWRALSSPELCLEVDENRVYIDVAAFESHQGFLDLHDYNQPLNQCPQIATSADKAKYKRYEIVERFCRLSDEYMVAQGKLVRQADGRLFLHASGLFAYPSFVGVCAQGQELDLVDTVAEQAGQMQKHQRFMFWWLGLNGLGMLAWWWGGIALL